MCTTLRRVADVSDAPLGPNWWQAGDGKWYPAPPGLDGSSAPAPTPPPDHDPVPPVRRAPLAVGVYGAGRAGLVVEEPTPARHRGRSLLLGVVGVLVILGLLGGLFTAVVDRSSARASSDDRAYQQAIVDLLDSEQTNLVFLQTFWEDHTAHMADSVLRSGRITGAVDTGWLDDMQAQIDQFALDLIAIDALLEERPWSQGSVPDTIRDKARVHYQTWQRWVNDLPALARAWIATPQAIDLQSWIDEKAPQLGIAIDETFRELCATLAETAPSDGRFDSTIAEICE